MSTKKVKKIKIVVVGDDNAGKDTLCASLMNKDLSEVHTAAFEQYEHTLKIEDQEFYLDIRTVIGQPECVKLRALMYPFTDCFIVCYPITSHISFRNVETFWIKEIKEFVPDAPVVLAATKCDLRNKNYDINFVEVDISSGQELAEKIQAHDFVECSAFEDINVNKVFGEAVMAAIQKKNPRVLKRCGCGRHKNCNLL